MVGLGYIDECNPMRFEVELVCGRPSKFAGTFCEERVIIHILN